MTVRWKLCDYPTHFMPDPVGIFEGRKHEHEPKELWIITLATLYCPMKSFITGPRAGTHSLYFSLEPVSNLVELFSNVIEFIGSEEIITQLIILKSSKSLTYKLVAAISRSDKYITDFSTAGLALFIGVRAGDALAERWHPAGARFTMTSLLVVGHRRQQTTVPTAVPEWRQGSFVSALI
ncbi:uncharacterized protein PHALS_04279 [Plasmopara halstedii]|uniref:Uncharacterized protein n=1 Tax=Plasmopara halstedii TaxID=4781 RepID=A0A0N7L7L4_PLAHL|nr:uncharacterized protein PHALS_04279 [Plasmopara halstedii]CEG47403.1 hypothetical protein PHALS_04279 [Plasmopara halstedii]|eukprot:XP_024583772.1 hypothetical protein PHALS_04279 [Plasmopara halstedii]